MFVKYRDFVPYSLSLRRCKIQQTLKSIQSYLSSSKLEIDLSLMRENSYVQKKFTRARNLIYVENLYI